MVRLQKYLAEAGVASRRAGEQIILAGRVAVNGETVGVAIFDHPQNPRYPTWWHVRDYGLLAANPFGQHDFEGLKNHKTAGNFVVPAGKSVTFRYRFYLHEGDEKQARVAEHFREYVRENPKSE